MRSIAEGEKPKQVIYQECLAEMKKIFNKTMGHAPDFKAFFANKLRQGQGFGGGGGGGGGTGGPDSGPDNPGGPGNGD